MCEDVSLCDTCVNLSFLLIHDITATELICPYLIDWACRCACGSWQEGYTYRIPVCGDGQTGSGAVGAGVGGMQEVRDLVERGREGEECWPRDREVCLCGREEVE